MPGFPNFSSFLVSNEWVSMYLCNIALDGLRDANINGWEGVGMGIEMVMGLRMERGMWVPRLMLLSSMK